MNKNQNADIKTIDGWGKSDKNSWDSYAKPGDIVIGSMQKQVSMKRLMQLLLV